MTASSSTDVVVALDAGRVRGRLLDSANDRVARFGAVPYAQPPQGALRFAPPVPPARWDGVRTATGADPSPGPTAPQSPRGLPGLDLAPVLGAGWQRGADYLSLDVWTPDPGGAGLPVMVFIHGGAFVAGTGSAPVYDGAAFASGGVVLVTINYRLGAEGFLAVADAPTNIGLRDQLRALEWVQENVAAFGGDPAQVTVFGESAGAMSIGMLLAAPQAEGLFRRAIVQSGGADVGRSFEVSTRLAARFGEVLDVPATAAALREVPIERLVEAQAAILADRTGLDLRDGAGVDPGMFVAPFLPVLGDDVVPGDPIAAIRAGAGAGVELVIGSNVDEGNLYVVPAGWLDLTEAQAVALLAGSDPDPGATLARFATHGSPGRALSATITERLFAAPVRRLAEAHAAGGGRSAQYLFGWRSSAFAGELGACHTMELPFVFDTVHAMSDLLGAAPPRALAREMHGSWLDFARGMDPDTNSGWPAYPAVREFG